ncbi:RND transporter [Burkholderia cepacia]|uniref:efflux transporter outer membrane subunit n=1 Tax=Burkholderia cepacia TaxID=292 RepID=UPI000752346F|nr:efflux transporter outer membrane subunit [Burkholderia cepacia]KVA43454.1 RND transporter [Burkholderia cepacia]KVA52640.1 RND transporter [Burkholderia cepacia]KVA70883.1 RND transporter [Burkholderia cepacia]KVA82666.1 RND transporter [Burkholderia cepacia]KVA83006.1 RND transporter [Burkholderia cepacia]
MVSHRVCLMLFVLAVASGCSFAPTYQVPAIPVPAAFKETGRWKTARPAEWAPRDAWWSVYHDPGLNILEASVESANPDVAAALARHDEALAYLAQARAGWFPMLGANADATTNRQSEGKPLRGTGQPNIYGSHTLSLSLSYDLDLWGKVRSEVVAGRAQAEAAAADLASVRLSLQATLAKTYFTLRGLDEQQRLLADTISTYERALQLTASRHTGGIASALDVSRAQAQLASARASADDLEAHRALCEHAIAALVGKPASTFTLASSDLEVQLPSIPAGVPTTLLERRPDIASAERHVAAANAQIGVARTAYFPDISLGIEGGFQSATLSSWLAAPNELWSLGPQLMLTLFDGGRRSAVTERARAEFAENGARYKAVVLKAFQEVEDNLALEHHLGDEAQREQEALDAANNALRLSMSRYRDGAVSYLDVVTAQTTQLQTQTENVELKTRRFLASVGLIEALGGGWSVPRVELTSASAKGPVALTQ